MAEALREKREKLFWEKAFSGEWKTSQGRSNPYSLTATSERIGVKKSALSTWEKGISVPSSQEKWEKWAEAVGSKVEFRLEFR
jgi:hypothetical protein